MYCMNEENFETDYVARLMAGATNIDAISAASTPIKEVKDTWKLSLGSSLYAVQFCRNWKSCSDR